MSERYVAFLRGVTPMNLKMPALEATLEKAGLDDVSTLLSSGNAIFATKKTAEAALEKKIESAMAAQLGRVFVTYVRSVKHLQALLASDPFSGFRLPKDAKRIVSFVREAPKPLPKFPLSFEKAVIYGMEGREVFTAYVRQPGNPAFMKLLERTFGDAITTRTWETVEKAAK